MQVWDAGSKDPIRTVWADVKQPGAVSFAPKSLLALTGAGQGSSDCTMKLWDLGPARVPVVQEHPAQFTCLAASGDGRIAALARLDGTVDVIDTATNHSLRVLGSPGRDEPDHVVALSADGPEMLEGLGPQLRLWGLTTDEMVTLGTHNSGVRAAAFFPDGRFALSQSGSQICYWDLSQRKLVNSIELDKSLWPRVLGNGISFSPEGSRAVGVNTHGAVMSFQLPAFGFIPTPGYFNDGHVPSELGAAVLPGGVETVNGTGNDVVIWNAFTGLTVHTFTGHLGLVNAVAVSPDGAWAASAGSDATVRIWDLAQRTDAGALNCGAASSSTITITPDGPKVMAGGKDRVVRSWDFSLPQSCRSCQPDLDRARAALRDNPSDPEALAVLGRWYALRGANAWAADLLRRARTGGADVSPLMLARCCWELGENQSAAAEFRRALERAEAPRPYLGLCIAAAERAAATRLSDSLSGR